jgi:hypothetical protein
MPPLDLLTSWVRRQAEPEAAQRLDARLAALAAGAPERDLVIALGFVPRRLGKADLVLDEADLAAAHDARAHWDPTGWSLDQAARLALLLATDDGDEAAFARRVDSLCQTGDVGELEDAPQAGFRSPEHRWGGTM